MKKNKPFTHDKETMTIVLFIFIIGISFFFLLLLKDSPFSLSPTGNAISHVNVTKAPPEECNFSLYQGNNLVSFHCLTSLSDRDYVLSTINETYNSIFAYNPNSIDSWISYNPELPSWVVQDLSYIDNRKGYWLIMKNDTNFYHNGSISEVTFISLSTNWNLIGYPKNKEKDVNTALASIQGNYSIILAYNTTLGSWESAGPLGLGTLINMSPDRGYWIFMDASDQLNVTWE